MKLTDKGIKGNYKLITIEEAGCEKRSILVVEKTRGTGRFRDQFSHADLVVAEDESGKAEILKDRMHPETGRKYNLRNLLAKLVWTDTRASAKYRPYLNVLVVLDHV